MKDLFVPYHIAVKLKQKGFKNHDCLTGYLFDGSLVDVFEESEEILNRPITCNAPLWQQALDFIIKKGINIKIDIEADKFYTIIHLIKEQTEYTLPIHNKCYYSALQSGIEKALELI